MEWNRTVASEWGCIVSGIVAGGTAIIWFAEKMPGGLWFPSLMILSAGACAILFYLGKRFDRQKPAPPPPPPELPKSVDLIKPDMTVKDSDPQLEIKIADLRGRTGSDKPIEQACFDLINRGQQSSAKFVCIEDFNIGGYRVAFRSFPQPIPPFANHESIFPLYINKPDGKLCEKDIFTVCFYAWDDLKNQKLYDWPIPIKATYQDDARNLFEVRCDLIFYPQEHAKHQNPRLAGYSGGTILETKNHKIRKVSAVLTPINWSD